MPLEKTHEEPTYGGHTGTAYYFHASGSMWSDTLKVVELTPNTKHEGVYSVFAWRQPGWTALAGHVEADSPEGVAILAMKIQGREVKP